MTGASGNSTRGGLGISVATRLLEEVWEGRVDLRSEVVGTVINKERQLGLGWVQGNIQDEVQEDNGDDEEEMEVYYR